ncbi:MAG: TlpA disulfide reductase family protein [Bacteroidota bacterium]
MKKFICIILVLVSFSNAFSQVKEYETYSAFAKAHLENLEEDKVYVINFWATWCAPCIKELPYFESLSKSIDGHKTEVLLVSLDFGNQIKNKLYPFVEKKQLKSEVVVLTDGNANSWIEKIYPSWTGAIPATLILHNEQLVFYEKSYHSKDELEDDIKKILN